MKYEVSVATLLQRLPPPTNDYIARGNNGRFIVRTTWVLSLALTRALNLHLRNSDLLFLYSKIISEVGSR